MQKILQARTKKVYFQFVECSYILSKEQSEICTCSWREIALWKRTEELLEKAQSIFLKYSVAICKNVPIFA